MGRITLQRRREQTLVEHRPAVDYGPVPEPARDAEDVVAMIGQTPAGERLARRVVGAAGVHDRRAEPQGAPERRDQVVIEIALPRPPEDVGHSHPQQVGVRRAVDEGRSRRGAAVEVAAGVGRLGGAVLDIEEDLPGGGVLVRLERRRAIYAGGHVQCIGQGHAGPVAAPGAGRDVVADQR